MHGDTLKSHQPIQRCNAPRFLLTWETVTGGASGILGRRLNTAASWRAAARSCDFNTASTFLSIFTLLAAALRDELCWREETVQSQRRPALRVWVEILQRRLDFLSSCLFNAGITECLLVSRIQAGGRKPAVKVKRAEVKS